MVISPDGSQVFLRVPKSASTWVSGVLCAGGWRLAGQPVHCGAWQVEEVLGARSPRIYGTIRAPAAWYYSLWRHAMSLPATRRDRQLLLRYNLGLETFEAWLYGATHPAEVIRSYPLPVPFLGIGPHAIGPRAADDLTLSTLALERAHPPRGLWSHTLAFMLGTRELGLGLVEPSDRARAWPPNLAGVFSAEESHLRASLADLLNGTPGEVEARNRPPGNVRDAEGGRGSDPPYDASMLDWIREADGPMLSAFGLDGASDLFALPRTAYAPPIVPKETPR